MVRTIILTLLISPMAMAADNVTAVFTDSQFTASNYGMAVAGECLNPNNIRDAREVRFFAGPNGSTTDLVENRNLPVTRSGQPFVHSFQSTSSGTTRPRRTERANMQPYFNAQLQDSAVNRVMIFMGVNEAGSRNDNWTTIADNLRRAGKQCFVSLPPLVNNEDLNAQVLQYNAHVANLLQETHCLVVDPSNTLEEDVSQRIQFQTSDGIHFSNSASQQVAQATCRAIAEAVQNANPRATQPIANVEGEASRSPVEAPATAVEEPQRPVTQDPRDFNTEDIPFFGRTEITL